MSATGMALEGLGVAASVIAVVELSAKVGALCLKYSHGVKNAQQDITRLQSSVTDLKHVYTTVDQLLGGQQASKLSASQQLRQANNECLKRLQQLERRLQPKKSAQTMSRFGLRAMKWPFDRQEVDRIISDLDSYKATVNLALATDQTMLIVAIDEKLDRSELQNLPFVANAVFDANSDEPAPRCHPNTRKEILHQIRQWLQDPHSKCIFWLNGMAGTGKSTIARTVAQESSDLGQLGASFFFKRGDADRENAAKFSPTIVTQLAHNGLFLAEVVQSIRDDPHISSKNIGEQFENLLLQPLVRSQGKTARAVPLLIVVDALDECAQDNDIQALLRLFARLQQASKSCLRVFLTSRPELPIRLGFRAMSSGEHQDVVLHMVPPTTISHDISVFLTDELKSIQIECNRAYAITKLPDDWPGEDVIRALTELASPLFISALTISRFVRYTPLHPQESLDEVLAYKKTPEMTQMERTYLPVIKRYLRGSSRLQMETVKLRFQQVVGSIILLAEPLSIISLQRLLELPIGAIESTLNELHSVLSIPIDMNEPITLLHLSFREFLTDPNGNQHEYWIDEPTRHTALLSACIKFMSGPEGLHKNICGSTFPGEFRQDIEESRLDQCISRSLRYACLHWVHHLRESRQPITDSSDCFVFLQTHLLHWLEVLGLLGRVAGCIGMVNTLQSLVAPCDSSQASSLLTDTRRFCLQNHAIIGKAPLQVYHSGLMFLPQNSVIKQRFKSLESSWLRRRPTMPSDWDAELQALEGHAGSVQSVAFSHDGRQLASASGDKTVKLWNEMSGTLLQTLQSHSDGVNSVAFSHDDRLLASASLDWTVKLWDVPSGTPLLTLNGHRGTVKSVAFSHNGKQLASVSIDESLRLWDVSSGTLLQTLQSHSGEVYSVAFSHDDRLLASASSDWTVKLWDVLSGLLQLTLDGHRNSVTSVAFSHHDMQLASASFDRTIKLWNTISGTLLQTFEGHSESLLCVTFSHDDKQLASAGMDGTIKLWNVVSGALLRTFNGRGICIKSVTFSQDDKQLASGGDDATVRLWDTKALDTPTQECDGSYEHAHLASLVFSHDGKQLASRGPPWCPDCTAVKLWDPISCRPLRILEGHSGGVTTMTFSHDDKQLASGSKDKTVKLWDMTTPSTLPRTLEGHADAISSLAFSYDHMQVASASEDLTVKLWDATLGTLLQTFAGHSDSITSVVFSHDSKRLASSSRDANIRLWDTTSGTLTQKFEGHSIVYPIAFSYDDRHLASACMDNSVRVWDACQSEVLPMTLEGHNGEVRSVAFSHNDKQLASSSQDLTVKVWEVTSGALLQSFGEQPGCFTVLRYSHDDRTLIVNTGRILLSCLPPPRDDSWPDSQPVLNCDGKWIMRNGQRHLWLPPSHRPEKAAYSHGQLVLGLRDGQLCTYSLP